MEEDIEILQRLVDEKELTGIYKTDEIVLQAIENLIARNKELEKQMGKDLDVVYLQGVYNERDRWKSKVREKIEEIIQNSSRFNCLSPLNYNDEYNATRYAVTKLEELLQEGDK